MHFKTVFWGNSEFCIPSLEVLFKHTQLIAIYTGLDKPIGRNQKSIKIPEPKEFGSGHGISVFQEQDLKNEAVFKQIESFAPDLMVVISYGKIIPKEIYNYPKYGTINIHASLLPKYRGAAPIQNSLLHGDSETGVSIQRINDKLDEGNVLLSKTTSISETENYHGLRQRLSFLSAELLESFLQKLSSNKEIEEFPQTGKGSYCKKVIKENGKILWAEESADDIYNKWRAFFDWPGIYTYYQGKMIKFNIIEKIKNSESGKPGLIYKADKEGLFVFAKKGSIKLLTLQPESKKAMDFISFLNGHRIKPGECFE